MTYSEEPDLKCSQFFTSLEHQIWQQLVHILAWLSWLELSFSHSASPAISIYLSVGFCMHSASPMAPNLPLKQCPPLKQWPQGRRERWLVAEQEFCNLPRWEGQQADEAPKAQASKAHSVSLWNSWGFFLFFSIAAGGPLYHSFLLRPVSGSFLYPTPPPSVICF